MTTARTRRWAARTAAVLAAAAVAGAAMPAAEARPPKGDTARVSEGPAGEGPDRESFARGLSGDGRYALFSSSASNLLPGGHGSSGDVYVRDLRNGHLERIGVAADGSALNDGAGDAAISGDGRYVAFTTRATNVLPGQRKHENDLFVQDRWTGRTELVTAGDGTSGAGDDQSIRSAHDPAVSWDGRYVAYSSDRTDLAPGVHGGKFNVFVTDRWTRTTRVVSTGADGTPADNSSYRPTISADGTVVGFSSRAGNLLPPDGAQPAAGTAVSPLASGTRPYPSYVWDARTGRTTGASLDEAGQLQGSGADGRISPSGRYAVYALFQPGGRPGSHGVHKDVFVHELATGKVTRVSTPLPGGTGTDSSFDAEMTLDDRWVFFASEAADLVPDDTNEQTDIFRTDLWTGRTDRVSLTADGTQSTSASSFPAVDAFGTTLLFTADDGNLVPGDTNGCADVFRRRL
ncbi:TolB family protein [Kitasatospora sp. NPDC058048]|uniref:TolB family protein n=1 Tax=Kitasatospora sp. NPDC058048 TaxID=3346313 RepID=UPI0036D8840D